jgi:hypothetical protein
MGKPIVREWLKEAFEISKGKKTLIKKQHIAALVDQNIECLQRLEKLNAFCEKLFEEVKKSRAARGLPPLPDSPSALRKG